MITRSAGLRGLLAAARRPRSGLLPAMPGVAALILAALVTAGLLGLALPLPAYGLSDDSRVEPSDDTAGGPDLSPDSLNGCPPGFVLDFSGLPAGTILGEQYASYGVHISAVANGDHPHAAIVFDSNASGSNDPDLEVHIGNISILASDLEDENGDGLVDFPDENNSGGAQIFAFDQPVHVGSFFFIDKDHGTPDKAIAYDASDGVIATALIPVAANGSVQTITLDADNVRRLEIVYRDSGGLTGIVIGCPEPATATPTPSPTPAPQVVPVTATPTQTPSVLSVVLPPVLPVILPATGGDPALGGPHD